MSSSGTYLQPWFDTVKKIFSPKNQYGGSWLARFAIQGSREILILHVSMGKVYGLLGQEVVLNCWNTLYTRASMFQTKSQLKC